MNFTATFYETPTCLHATTAPPTGTMQRLALTDNKLDHKIHISTPQTTTQPRFRMPIKHQLTPSNQQSIDHNKTQHSTVPTLLATASIHLIHANERNANIRTSAPNARIQDTLVSNAHKHQTVHHSSLQPANRLPSKIITPVNVNSFSRLIQSYPKQ